MVQDQHQLSEPQAPLTIIDLLLLLMFITAASRKSDFGENRTECFLLQNTQSWQDSDSIWYTNGYKDYSGQLTLYQVSLIWPIDEEHVLK